MDKQRCFALVTPRFEVPMSYPAGVPARGSRGVEGLKARVKRRKSAPVLAWKGASGKCQLQLQSAALAQSVA